MLQSWLLWLVWINRIQTEELSISLKMIQTLIQVRFVQSNSKTLHVIRKLYQLLQSDVFNMKSSCSHVTVQKELVVSGFPDSPRIELLKQFLQKRKPAICKKKSNEDLRYHADCENSTFYRENSNWDEKDFPKKNFYFSTADLSWALQLQWKISQQHAKSKSKFAPVKKPAMRKHRAAGEVMGREVWKAIRHSF